MLQKQFTNDRFVRVFTPPISVSGDVDKDWHHQVRFQEFDRNLMTDLIFPYASATMDRLNR